MRRKRSKQLELPLTVPPRAQPGGEFPTATQHEIVEALADLLLAAIDAANDERGERDESEDHR